MIRGPVVRRCRDEALKSPLLVTHDGRDRPVIMSADEYERLKRHGRERFWPAQSTAGGFAMTHERIGHFNPHDTCPEQNLDNDLCPAVAACGTVLTRAPVNRMAGAVHEVPVVLRDLAGRAGKDRR